MSFSHPGSEISGIHHHHQGNPDGSGEGVLPLGLGNPEKCNSCPLLPWVRQLLQMVNQRLLEGGDAIHQQKNEKLRYIAFFRSETQILNFLSRCFS